MNNYEILVFFTELVKFMDYILSYFFQKK